jgi:hypothetical protein
MRQIAGWRLGLRLLLVIRGYGLLAVAWVEYLLTSLSPRTDRHYTAMLLIVAAASLYVRRHPAAHGARPA